MSVKTWWNRRCADRRALKAAKMSKEDIDLRVGQLKQFWFLADAPLFVDQPQIEKLFYAIYKPEFELNSRARTVTKEVANELESKASTSGELALPGFLKVSAGIEGTIKGSRKNTNANAITESAVNTPEGRLEKLIMLYAFAYQHRIFWIGPDIKDLTAKSKSWTDVEAVIDQPGIRPFVVIDLDRKSKVIPTFCETTSGRGIAIYKTLADILWPDSPPGTPNPGRPVYPDTKDLKFQDKANKYWKDYADGFNSDVAIEAIEQTAASGSERIEWINYRIPIAMGTPGPDTIHLNLSSRGIYSTGTFAYQFVRRADRQGIRIVGTLKRGAAINVLAIYEK